MNHIYTVGVCSAYIIRLYPGLKLNRVVGNRAIARNFLVGQFGLKGKTKPKNRRSAIKNTSVRKRKVGFSWKAVP